jgi:uncharacterized damage-inducible protein DinB
MYTSDGLRDLHERTHRSLIKLLDHCDGFSPEELSRELDGFGYGSIREQLQHMIGAEQYWVGVLYGEMLVDEDEADRVSIDALRAFRLRVFEVTTTYLDGASSDELNTQRSMLTWGDREQDLVPAHVVLRTQTHVFQHQGQVAAMARLLGRPIPPGLDFPLG